MERKVVVVCAVVGFLGVLSPALGFAAEATRVKVSDVQISSTPGECVYPRTPALALGLISAVSLMLAQSIINTVAGCICCKRHPVPSDTNWSVFQEGGVLVWRTSAVFNFRLSCLETPAVSEPCATKLEHPWSLTSRQ